MCGGGPLIKILKVLYELEIKHLFHSSYTNKYLFTLYIMEGSSVKNIKTEDITFYINDDGRGVRPKQQNKKIMTNI